MGQMQRRKRIGREIMGLARRKVLSPKVVSRRFVKAAEARTAAFAALADGLDKLAKSGFMTIPEARRHLIFDESVPINPAWFDGPPAKTFDNGITAP